MDHLLTSNDRVTDTLMQTVRESRTIVLFMSRGYLRSQWCQAEINRFEEENGAHKNKASVFVVAIDETNREDWPTRVRELTPIELFKRSMTGAIELLGYPNPPAESGSAYWAKLNELTHLIVKHLDQLGTLSRTAPQTSNVASSASNPRHILLVVWIAQPTDDLHTDGVPRVSDSTTGCRRPPARTLNIFSLRHLRVPTSIEADISGAVLLVQLLSATPGYPFAQGSGTRTGSSHLWQGSMSKQAPMFLFSSGARKRSILRRSPTLPTGSCCRAPSLVALSSSASRFWATWID